MAVTPQAHAAHSANVQSVRSGFGLPKMSLPNFGDMNLNKSGTIGTEPMGIPNGKGGYNRVTEVKMGSLGHFDIPNNKAGM